ncbi:hypothetical protein A11A3_00825 [Alcanivorax hongdengensis A-11-3]|uniref:Uncharacterized protein n=1 Tax=Alcanivorax hongdengensis A-11-3 TaxID=1177179 RepID=L0WGM0_9GAMM|nr:NirD/YgiW/YdeI family stress tolerance protein [Alcanivorax hongdengensis]EKF75993.1 hypothetical protein A11A3_00825 [Alcanivorax hongdengensis A-11-3]
MKKLILASVLIGATATAAAGNIINSDSAAIQQGLKEGTQVRLQGEIVQPLGDEHYLLRDRKGQVEIELDDDLTSGRPLKAGTQLAFTGEVDHDDGRSIVEVDKIESIQGAGSMGSAPAPTTSNNPGTVSN